jgi:lipopolysaccharide transport system ATP-binding protein
MQLRLAFAVAAFLENEILIIDEVLAVGDSEFQKKCIGKMDNVSKSGRTILFVSHNMGAVTQLCTRGIWLDNGKVKKDGKITDVVASYYDSTSAGFNKDGIKFENNKNGEIILESVVVNNGDYVYFGKEVTFSLSITCAKKIEDVVFGIGFSNNEGVRMLTIDSDVLSNVSSAQSIAEGKYRINVNTSNLSLHPGKYFVDIGIRDSKNTCSYLYMPQAFNIEVMPSDETPHFFSNNSFNGGYRLPNNTTITKAG